jgi:hypothetical protein
MKRRRPRSSSRRQSRRSRQRRWQLARIAAGRCGVCGQRRRPYASFCDVCMLRQRQRQRERCGHSRWRPGGPGRPPRVRDDGAPPARAREQTSTPPGALRQSSRRALHGDQGAYPDHALGRRLHPPEPQGRRPRLPAQGLPGPRPPEGDQGDRARRVVLQPGGVEDPARRATSAMRAASR